MISSHTPMDNRSAVLLAMADLRNDPAALAACELFLAVCKVDNTPTFAECSLKVEYD